EAVKENLTGTTDTEAVYIPAQKEGFTVADKISGNIAGDGSLVLKVYYSRNQWTVTWNINGKEYKSEVLYYGAEITAPEYTEKEGYTFTAWADVAATMPDNDVTYNATETVNEYTVTWNAGSGVFANGSNSIEQTYAYGAEIKEPEDPTCTGYNFNGWDKNVVGVMGAENVVYNAQWGVNTYIITYKDGNNTLATASYEYGAPVPSYDFDPETEGIQNPAKTGYTFNGWNQKIPATMPAENITVTAAWFANTNTAYTVEIYTMDVNGQYGKAVKEKLTGTTDTEAVYIPAQKEGFTVADKISGNIAGDGSLVLKVYYSRNQWTVTWNINGEKYESEDLYYGAKITAPEYTEKEGYTFTAWANVAETMPDHDLAYDAAETRNSYKLTFVVDDASTEQLVLYGDPVTAPAAPEKEGYVFVGWNDGENTYVPVNGAVTLPNMGAADVTYTAEWSLEKYKITFNSNGGSDVQPITAEYKSLVYAPEAPVMNDFVFDCWIDADGSKVEWPVEMPLNGAEFTAVWLADANNNGVNDELEIVAVKVIGNGSVTVDGESVTEILYDSTADVFVTIAATPVIENAVSKSYVSAIMLDQENAEFTYMADFSAEATLKVNGADEITAVFADCAFVYDEDGMLSYYVGIDTPEAKELYEAVIVDPAYSEYVKSVQYLARPADKYSVTIPVLLDIDVFGRNIKIGGNTVEVDLDDAWLNVGDTFKVLTEEELQKMIDDEVAAIKDKISKINYKDITFQNFGTVLAQLSEISNDLEDLVAVITNEAKYLGYHAFGSVENAKTDENGNVQEILKVEYVDAAKRLFDDAIVITLVDDRIETAIIGGDVEFEYDEYDNDDILAALTLTAEGEGAIEGECKILTDLSGKDVGEYTYHVYYDGSSEYKPAAAEFTLTVVKAPASIDVPNVSAVYGSSYSAKPVITNKHDETINANLIEVFVGVDVSELDVNADGVHNVSGKIQLIPSNDIRTVLALIGLEEGKTYSVSEIASILNNASDVLGTFGVNSDIAGVINNAVNELSSVLSGVDADITIGGSYPTNIGVYLHGAVISDSNYKTAFDIGYLLIAPETTEHELTWYVNDENFVVTLPLAQDGEYLKALADGEDNSSIEYLYLGVNGKNDIEFVHTSAAEINECGAYIQIAYLLNWGNEVAYAKPILRPVVVVPEVYTITFVDENGNENNDRVFEFDNTEKAMKAVVTDEYGNEVSDADLTVTYIGIQTNGKTYNSTTAPKHAGVYSVFATIFECDEDGVPTAAGMAAGAMAIVPTTANVNVDNDYKLYDGENVFSYMDLDDADTVKLISASSKVEGLTPDITIISAALVSEIGAEYAQDWQFADVSVNIDLPAWLDSYLPENMKDGADWAAVQNWLNGLVAANEELSAFISEYELTSYVETLTETLAQFYDLSDITFYDFDEVIENENPNVANPAVAPSKVGAYLIAAVVTDSDHIPAADTGVLVITPALADVYFVDENGNKNNDRIFTYDGNAKEMKAVVEVNGEIVENAQIVPYYAGVESVIDTPLYHSVSAPSETGAYAVIAVYVGQDEQGRITAIGACVGAMAIEPAEAEIAVEGVVANEAVIVNDLVSTKPETGVTTTVITTGLKLDYELVAAAANGDVTGIADIYSYVDYINIDLPAYIDEALKLAEFDGDVTVGTLIAKLNELKSTYADVKAAARKLAGEYAELKALAGAIVELTGLDIDTVIEQLKIADDGIEMAVDQLIAALDLYEDTLIVTTIDNYAVSETGVYNVTAIVTDSDYLPAAASDFVVIVPVFAEVLVDDKLYTFDGEEKNAVVIVKENGEVIAEPDHLIVTYTGVQTDGKIYETTTAAPKYAGVYAVAALYYRGENQTLEAFGAGAGVIVIKPAMLTVEIPEDKNTFDYDGEEHAPTAVITTEGEGRYKTVITAVKVNDTTVNVIMDEAVIELIKSVIAAMDETYDAAKELPADVKALIKGVAKLAGFEANDLEQLKALVKASIDGTIEVENYVAAIAKVEKLLTAARDNAKELVDTYGAKAAAELSELIGADAAEIAKAYAEKAVDLLAAYSQKAIDAVADIKAYVQSTGITSVTINGANPVEVGVYPVIALGYLNSDHMIGIVKGKMEIVETRWHIDKDRMQLQNSLNMQFAFSTEHEENWDGYYAQIVAHHEENTVTKTIPASEWKSVTISGVKYHMITFADLAAKQMADLIEITVYDANGDAASFTWENSIRDHAMRNYKQYGDESKRLMVDMLNYGAAAQKHFDYNTDDLANNLLTEEHLAYATPSVTVENKIEVTGSDYYGTNFDLESRISMQYAFENITDDMYAVVTFKNHHNSEKNLTI
ncbi:MAG: InlB B-repeat-containing protein, partial [Clostridia bacterium]|nr:InlB B-repeat-containing protein [Clostridia bacterium]